VLVGFLVLGKVEGWGRREYINRRKRMAIAIVRKRAKFFYLNW
jgi:hypothetical protein